MFRRSAIVLVGAACALAALLAGCAKKKVIAIGDLPPETTLFVQGPTATVPNLVHLYWFGSDPDGQVVGYEIRFKNLPAPEDGDTAWVFTARTDSVISVFDPTGLSTPRFEVRAVDDHGLRDPSAAFADFSFSNQAPTVSFTNRLKTNDSTYAAVTLSWNGADPDGDVSVMQYQVGLDTLPAALRIVHGTSVSLDTTDFKIAGAYPTTRPRQAYVRAIDGGGRVSAWDSVRWVVRAPSAPGIHPRLLLIDDVPHSNAGEFGIDTLWANAVARNLAAGSYSLLQLQFTQPFRSNRDLTQTFRLFDAVIWYRGTENAPSTVMRDRQDGIAAYLDGGGKFLVESLHLIDGENDAGSLRPDWLSRYLGSDDLILSPIAGRIDSTVSWTINAGYIDTLDATVDPPVTVVNRADLHSTMVRDSLRNGSISSGLRGFVVRDTNQVLLWARDSTLSPRVKRDIPIALAVPAPGSPGGTKMIAITLPLRGTNGFLNLARFLSKVFSLIGLTTP